ncbi:MAG TPA: O-antigen ligase family protein [Thermoanaerobaculia bacterium]|nr:O-antigen ligase family protein [Thermoanaerobaculia bacterium]
MSVTLALPVRRNVSLVSIGVPLLVAIVYLNLSEILVRYHDFPSILQPLIAGLAFVAWLERDCERPLVVAAQRLTIAIGIYFLIALASTCWALDAHRADERLLDLAKAVAIYLLLALLLRTERAVRNAVRVMIAAAALLGLLILHQVATGNFEHELGGLGRVKQAHIYGDVFDARVAGPVGDPNFFGRLLLLPIPPAVLLAFQTKSRGLRCAFLLAALLIAATIAVTYSRGAMVALAVMALLLLHALHVRWRSTFLVAAALLALVVVLPPTITERFITIEQILPSDDEPLHPDSSFEERRMLMRVAWRMFEAHPVGGVGIGNYTTRFDDHAGSIGSAVRPYNEPSETRFPHNLALELAAETGLLGLTAFAAIVAIAWSTLRRAARRLSGESGVLAASLSISLVGFVVAGLFLHLSEARTIFLMFAFASALERIGAGTAEGAAA